MTYETAFARGERDAFDDRFHGVSAPRPGECDAEDLRGYMDGYTPRTLAWSRPHREVIREAKQPTTIPLADDIDPSNAIEPPRMHGRSWPEFPTGGVDAQATRRITARELRSTPFHAMTE